MSYIGLGQAGQVLTILSGLAQWGAAVAAGGGFGVTVAGPAAGVVADFASIELALAANNNVITVIGDVTESIDIAVPSSGLSLNILENAIVDIGAQQFDINGNLDIQGNGALRYSYAALTTLFNVSASELVSVNSIEIRSEGAASGTLSNGTDGRFDNIKFTGGVLLDGTRNVLTSARFNSDLIIDTGAVNCQVSSSQRGGVIVDFGSGTLLSDIKSF